MDSADCGHDAIACGASLHGISQSSSRDVDSYSLLNTEKGDDGQPNYSNEVVHSLVVSDVHDTSGFTDSLLKDATSKEEQERESSQSCIELSQKIINQVEYYFSDENLVKDSFLMQRINRDKRGYVDLKLIASFKKMKKLTQDISVIADALHNSKKLEVNKAGTMVRRIAPLPVTKEEAAALKTCIAVNFSESSNLAEQFGVCGSVSRVRVVSKNDKVPSDVRRHLKRSVDDGGRAITAIALIEYDDEKYAQAACENLTDSSDWRHGLHVSMLVARSPDKRSASANKSSPMKESNDRVEDETQSLQIKQKTKKKNRSRVEAILQDESAGCSSSGSETEGQEQMERKVSGSKRKPRGNSSKGRSSPVSHSNFVHSVLARNKNSLADDLRGEVRARSGSTGTIECGSVGISPWVQKRLQAAKYESKSAGSSMTDLSAGDTVSMNKPTHLITVLRQPRGPDGTKGFSLLR